MPQVIILPTEAAGRIAVGETLLDAGEQAGIEMEAGCFNGECGACLVEVVDGGGNLEPAGVGELEVLEAWGRDPVRFRLACCARVREGTLTIRQLD